MTISPEDTAEPLSAARAALLWRLKRHHVLSTNGRLAALGVTHERTGRGHQHVFRLGAEVLFFGGCQEANEWLNARDA